MITASSETPQSGPIGRPSPVDGSLVTTVADGERVGVEVVGSAVRDGVGDAVRAGVEEAVGLRVEMAVGVVREGVGESVAEGVSVGWADVDDDDPEPDGGAAFVGDAVTVGVAVIRTPVADGVGPSGPTGSGVASIGRVS
jgi:hypothetical protein